MTTQLQALDDAIFVMTQAGNMTAQVDRLRELRAGVAEGEAMAADEIAVRAKVCQALDIIGYKGPRDFSDTDFSPRTEASIALREERRRQLFTEGYTDEHDDGHDAGDLPQAAACYCLVAAGGDEENTLARHNPLTWNSSWFKNQGPKRNLVKAGALILAALERQIRQERRENKEPK